MSQDLLNTLHIDSIVNTLYMYTGDPKRVIGKQCRPRSNAIERGVWSGSPLSVFSLEISKSHSLMYLKLKLDSSNIYYGGSLFSLQWVKSKDLQSPALHSCLFYKTIMATIFRIVMRNNSGVESVLRSFQSQIKEVDARTWVTILSTILLLFWKGIYSKKKESICSLGANYFLLE